MKLIVRLLKFLKGSILEIERISNERKEKLSDIRGLIISCNFNNEEASDTLKKINSLLHEDTIHPETDAFDIIDEIIEELKE